VVLADADVDAANLELLLAPEVRENHGFTGGKRAVIDVERCQGCGLCVETCRFDAIGIAQGSTNGHARYQVDPVACEGCAACSYRCPEHAIRMVEQLAGRWYLSATRFGPLVHARLFAGQENSGKLVTRVKLKAQDVGLSEGRDYLLIDGPPGIGCPAIAACSGSDLALVVTEPTVAGAHDLERMLGLLEHFEVPASVCINKWDVNPKRAEGLERECAERGIAVVGRIPFDVVVTEAMVRGQAVTEASSDNPVARKLRLIWAGVKAALG
jgi:MinD superfamily P-loop ATPase